MFVAINIKIVLGSERLKATGPAKMTIPILITHGTDDVLTSCPDSKAFIESCSSMDKEHVEYKDWKHELHNEAEWKTVADKYITWILKHSKK